MIDAKDLEIARLRRENAKLRGAVWALERVITASRKRPSRIARTVNKTVINSFPTPKTDA